MQGLLKNLILLEVFILQDFLSSDRAQVHPHRVLPSPKTWSSRVLVTDPEQTELPARSLQRVRKTPRSILTGLAIQQVQACSVLPAEFGSLRERRFLKALTHTVCWTLKFTIASLNDRLQLLSQPSALCSDISSIGLEPIR